MERTNNRNEVVALLESQRFDNKSIKTNNYWFIFIL